MKTIILLSGSKTSQKNSNQKSTSAAGITGEETEEPLDLADLDLSRLRLSKKDLETLSNIAPGLPKCFQEQLLAKLPPTQAKKLSRTLSVQTNQNCGSVQVYKRSQSSGRSTKTINKAVDQEVESSKTTTSSEEKYTDIGKDNSKSSSVSSTQKIHSRSKSNDENSKDFGSLCNSDINDKYKYYSPYVNKVSKDTSQNKTTKDYTSESTSSGANLGRPPSGRLSPPPSADAGLRRPTQRRISRLIRPDYFEVPLEELPGDINAMPKTVESETVANETSLKTKISRHTRNKSVEILSESTNSSTKNSDTLKHNRRSLSRSRDLDEKNKIDKNQLADKILQELQILSSIRSQGVEISNENIINNSDIINEKSVSTIKKIKKVKTKEKSTESSTDADTKNTTTVIKKVKKIVKKSESVATPVTNETPKEISEDNHNNEKPSEIASPKKVSKLKRPKSYPMKESVSSNNTSEIMDSTQTTKTLEANSLVNTEHLNNTSNLSATEISNTAATVTRESRLLRPKSYPTSKLVAPKETKHIIRKKINTIEETSATNATICQKTESLPMCSTSEKVLPINEQATETTTSQIGKKVVKVTKKNKLTQPSSLSTTTTTTTTPNTTSSNGDESKESSPVSNVQVKEKAVEKKANKGLLYAIGQKFEKLRASATSNSCANIPTQKKSSIEKSSPEKVINKIPEVKKTKSLGGNTNVKGTNSSKLSSKASTNSGSLSTENSKPDTESVAKPAKSEKRSRIDAMIRNLRERSVPRSQPTITSESNYIKRAVSVEEMPGTFNKKSVNKVLGLFKRYEKDANPTESQVRSARSTSNIEREISESCPIYQNAEAILKQNETNEKCANNVSDSKTLNKISNNVVKNCKGGVQCNCNLIASSAPMEAPDCCIKAREREAACNLNSTESNQEKRKGLVLDLGKSEKSAQHITANQTSDIRSSMKYRNFNDNQIYSNISPYTKTLQNSSNNQAAENLSNNNISSIIKKSSSSINNNNNNNSSSLHTSQTSGYRTSSTHEMNQNNNLLSPSFENIGNYSSDSRSYQEDCASTSTFLSPTEEAELCFDTWSVCSEDNYRGQRATPSPTVSHLSRASQASSPTRRGGDSSEGGESVVDRIKRRSFYCRFNEKKPKRTSSIVGPNAVREYYREQRSASKTRSSSRIAATGTGEREHSPDITQEFFRPLKLSPIGTELKPPVYRSSFSNSHDYSSVSGRPRKSLNDIRTPTSPSCLSERRYASFANPENDLPNNTSSHHAFPSRYKTNTYDEVPRSGVGSTTNTYYNTYNPKRRFSFTTNSGVSSSGISSHSNPQVEGYATMGRRPIRAYDHRTMSLLDTPSTNTYRHESSAASSSLRDYTSSLSR